MFSIYLCRLRLKSFCDFIVVCNVTWQYFKDIIIIISLFIFWYFAWSINVIRMGVLTPIHWELKKRKINHSVEAETYRDL